MNQLGNWRLCRGTEMSGYGSDILAWSDRQSGLLRRIAAGERVNDADVDWPNIAEEIESVGRSERLALSSHIETIIEHLMKLEASPANEPRAGWEDTVIRARSRVDELLEASPSMRGKVPEIIAQRTGTARRLAQRSLTRHAELPLIDLSGRTYGEDQVIGDWLPTPA
jgi:Domain of unknown function DUF29